MKLVFKRASADDYRAALLWYRTRSEAAARYFMVAVRSGVNAIRLYLRPWPVFTGAYRFRLLEKFPCA